MLATEGNHRQIRLLRPSGSSVSAARLSTATLALAFLTGLLLVQINGLMPPALSHPPGVSIHAGPQVYFGKKVEKSPTPIKPSPTATSTVAAGPPTIKVVSPSSGQGPVGARVSVRGANFSGNGNFVHLFGSSRPDCGASSGTLSSTQVVGGKITAGFFWPVSFPIGTYYICADGMASSTATYQVLTSSPPMLSLSTSTVQMEQPLTIQGSNFVGAAAGTTVSFSETTAAGSGPDTLAIKGALNGNGNFSVTWLVAGPLKGSVIIQAFAEQEGTSAPVLQASATVTIQAAATPTASISTTASASATASGAGAISTTSGGSSNSTGTALLIIFLISAIILTLLAIVGIVIFLTMRRRGTGRYRDSETRQTGGYAAYGNNPDYWGYNVPPAGQVAGWGDDDPDSQPGPNWNPRPMTGYYPRFDADLEAPPPGPDSGWGQSRQIPADPWNNSETRMPDPANDQWPDLGGNGGDFWP